MALRVEELEQPGDDCDGHKDEKRYGCAENRERMEEPQVVSEQCTSVRPTRTPRCMPASQAEGRPNEMLKRERVAAYLTWDAC